MDRIDGYPGLDSPRGNARGSKSVRFGLFEVDLEREEIRRNGIRIKLQQQPFEVLRLLLMRHGQFVTREDLRQALWPSDHFVDFEQSISTAVMKLRQALRENAGSPIYIETVPRKGYRFIAPLQDASHRAITAIAILPLQDLSATPDNGYFVDGLTDSLITEMAVRSGLRVVPRPTAQRYRNSSLSMREIARELEVEAIVEGSVLRSGDRIRISARLLHALDERHLWAQTFERDLKDVLFLQRELVNSIVNHASLAISRNAASPQHARSIQPAAYEAFLRANFLVSVRAPKSLLKAIENYQSAISIEPTWAAPHAGLAEAYRIHDFAKHKPSAEVASHIIRMTETALRLDPHNAQAQATLGAVLAMNEWKWKEGEDRIKLALRATVQSSSMEHLYAAVLLTQGRHEEALLHNDIALSLDQSSLYLRSYRAQILLFARRYRESLSESECILEENPTFAMGLVNYGAVLLELKRTEEAVSVLERAFTSAGVPVALSTLVEAYCQLGKTNEARSALSQLYEIKKATGCSPVILALAHLALREIDQAFDLFLEAAKESDIRLPLMLQLAVVDCIRNDRRYTKITEMIGLPALRVS
ncbi:winged helix-turn-helix domain-containing protein [Terriglobus roseus]|uniref:TolB amino-terminal domain-containing protein n=1 Tax=Terriglobus roseus TaxID=392734 RepID=A0A1G7KSQ5_9BACT|nr:winged helix-turn-helix domain-containing protein [Terriglobus roseus]SDF40288.1 TolB amino-terminal domain-containing protein [Terriglobus roseus]